MPLDNAPQPCEYTFMEQNERQTFNRLGIRTHVGEAYDLDNTIAATRQAGAEEAAQALEAQRDEIEAGLSQRDRNQLALWRSQRDR